MFRKLSLAVAISGLLSPVGVHALGLGDIHLGSALNQRLNAEISVHLARTEELDDIKIELASPEAFARAGIGRPFILSGLKFSPVQNSGGETIIAVTSREPIREPFLNFLVEVNWPKGRLVREYTVLLDPPVTVQRQPAQVESPVIAPRVRATSAAPAVALAESGEVREYGPVVLEDTLWKIASRMRVEGETIEQVMMALLDNNPNAFIHNNINRLKRGSILRLPPSSDVKSLNRQEARSEFLAQTSQWRDQNSATALQAPKAPANVGSATTDEPSRLKLASASKMTTDSGVVEGSADKTVNLSKLEQELMLVRESNEVVRQEGSQLRARVSELETRLQDIQRLLTLRNDQLAEMVVAQQPVQSEQPVTEISAAEEMVDELSSQDSVAAVESLVQESSEMAPLIAEEGVAEEGMAGENEPVEAAVTEVAPVAEPPSPVVEPEPVVAAAPAPTPVSVKKSTGSIFSTILNDTTLMAAVGGAIALLLAMLALVIRRRKSTEAEFAESILVAPKDAAIEAESDVDLGPASADETSLLSDFSPSDIDALQDETGEVDPLSEADVYVAYGRYQQAEELIQQAIEKDDKRVELKFKLLEIYYSIQNKSAFVELAQRLVHEGAEGKDPQAWAQVVSMGHELVPTETLFGASATQEESDTNESPEENALDDLGELDDFDLGDLEAELGLDGDEDSLLNIDFEESLAGEEMVPEVAEQATTEAGDLDAEIDLPASLDDIGSDEMVLDLGDLPDVEESLDLDDLDLSGALGEDESINLDDLSLSLDSELAIDEPDSADIASQLGGEELDLDSLGDELESLSDGLDSGDFEINLDEMSSMVGDEIKVEEEAEIEIDLDTEDGGLLSESDDLAEELSGDDEVETKLDLARAYADMGDKEGAENILQEVLNEGTAEQKEEAETLIKSFS
ncbi:MAG: hypothetical protein L3J28_13310 [Candidatus Polarisedimenticolaceae bacterium]|nr:hypothetical protein [Candidatus Polarisedimenticolaceae bacterium]